MRQEDRQLRIGQRTTRDPGDQEFRQPRVAIGAHHHVAAMTDRSGIDQRFRHRFVALRDFDEFRLDAVAAEVFGTFNRRQGKRSQPPASLIAHLQEESERPIGFIMSGAAAARIEFEPMEG